MVELLKPDIESLIERTKSLESRNIISVYEFCYLKEFLNNCLPSIRIQYDKILMALDNKNYALLNMFNENYAFKNFFKEVLTARKCFIFITNYDFKLTIVNENDKFKKGKYVLYLKKYVLYSNIGFVKFHEKPSGWLLI